MKISIKYTGSIINLPSAVVDTLKDAGENELKVLIGVTSFASRFNDFDALFPILCDKLDLDVNEIKKALSFWAKAGIIELEGECELSCDAVLSLADAENASPSFTGAQITKLLEENKEMESLFKSAQEVLGKSFNTHDYNSLLYIKVYFKFSDEYILMLLAHCAEIEKSSWAYIRKTAKNLYDEGIDTFEKLDMHFSARRNKRSLEYKIRRLFGVGEREFTKRERETFEKWINSKINFELIEKAYELTIDNIGKASLAYTTKVLDNWLENGIKTAEAATESIEKHKNKLSMSTFDTDDFFEAALKRSSEMFKEGSIE